MNTKKAEADYPGAVIDTLVPEFSDLADPTTAAVVREAILRYTDAPDMPFECIIDNPALANWRLRPHRDQRARVRVACYRATPTPTDNEREQRLNEALDMLPAPGPPSKALRIRPGRRTTQ